MQKCKPLEHTAKGTTIGEQMLQYLEIRFQYVECMKHHNKLVDLANERTAETP